ncbi:MAG: MarR family transcriptional regulator [Calditrichaeota bacterium]|nr:MAG: MarR family transcriptional regulator [Calditrichota bacterium]
MKKISDYTAEEQQVLDLFVKMIRASDSVLHRTHKHLADELLTLSQFQVLEILYHLGPMYQKEIAAKVLKTTGNLTMVVKNLTRNKLVKKTQDINDKRYSYIELTKKGEELMEQIFPKHLRILVEEFRTLTPSEQIKMAVICKKIGLGKQPGTS